MTQSDRQDRAGLTRRRFLKTTAAATGAALGSGAIGAPMIWALCR